MARRITLFALFLSTVLYAGMTMAGRKTDPYEAYKAGKYKEALEGFVDMQLEHPRDAQLALHIGSAHYKMRNYEEAEKAFYQAALNGDEKIREKAYYNLGNTAYRQGKLEQAVDWYKKALDLDPNDMDAKFNIEFVRDKIRKMAEEARKRMQQQKKQGQGRQEKNDDRNKGGDRQAADKREQSGGQREEQGRDRGKDEERQAQQEPAQRNGKAGKKREENPREQAGPAGKVRKLSKEEAERYLQGLQEDRRKYLKARRAAVRGKRYTTDKDW